MNYAALFADLAIAVGKYIAAAFSGSSAMMAEAIHSTIDAGNELLLLLGIRRSQRPADALHPYGHGKALYVYSLLVAVYIFGLGGILTIYEGISRLRHPQPITKAGWSYVVLALATLFNIYSFRVSYRELHARKDRTENLFDEIIGSKDPTVFTVFLEDLVSLAGTLLALFAIFLGKLLHNPYLDPAASVLIGLLLAAIALLLGRETGALLEGERTNRSRISRLKEIIAADSAVESVGDLLTMQLGPNEVLLTVNIKFHRGLDVPKLESAIDRIEDSIRHAEPTVARIFIEADSLRKSA